MRYIITSVDDHDRSDAFAVPFGDPQVLAAGIVFADKAHQNVADQRFECLIETVFFMVAIFRPSPER